MKVDLVVLEELKLRVAHIAASDLKLSKKLLLVEKHAYARIYGEYGVASDPEMDSEVAKLSSKMRKVLDEG